MEKKLKFVWILTIINSTILFIFVATFTWAIFNPTPNTDLGGWVEKTLKEYGEWTGVENKKTKEVVQGNLDSNLKQIQEIVDGNKKWVENSLNQNSQWMENENQKTRDWTQDQLDNNWKSMVDYVNNRL